MVDSDVDAPPVADDAPVLADSDEGTGELDGVPYPYSIELSVYSGADAEELVDDSVVAVPEFSSLDEGGYAGGEDSEELDEALVRVTG